MSTFTAAPQALGYLYQIRYALYLALTRPDEHMLSIEKFDDIAIEHKGAVTDLLQLKHHVVPGSLTDSSVDLWKTLRAWCTAVKEGTLEPAKTSLLIITTASAPSESIAESLRPSKTRDCKLAMDKLNRVARSSQNQTLASSFDAFRQLTEQEKNELLESVYVVDCASDIAGVKDDIQQRLRLAVRPQHIEPLYERLEGWWVGIVIKQLERTATEPIPCAQVRSKVDDLREQFRLDALPIDFFDLGKADASSDQRQFVSQLHEIGVGLERINKAISDHDRTFAQRSRWLREDLVNDLEISRYEDKLIDEWEREVLAINEESSNSGGAEEEERRLGAKVFNWVDRTANFPIRPLVSELHITRGSYHMLADQSPPRVWWHPRYPDRCGMVPEEPIGDRV